MPDGGWGDLEDPTGHPGKEVFEPFPAGGRCGRYDSLARRAYDAVRGIAAAGGAADATGLDRYDWLSADQFGWVELMSHTASLYPASFRTTREVSIYADPNAAIPMPFVVTALGSSGYGIFTLSQMAVHFMLCPPRLFESPVPINLYGLVPARLRPASEYPPAPAIDPSVQHPTWNDDTRELYWGNLLVKRFRKPAENQVEILAAFEKEGWPRVIPDPLGGKGDAVAAKRLGDTIFALNKGLEIPGIIRFERDGTGEGVRWERLVTPRQN